MLGNLISLAEDLKQYPDSWLMHEVQNPSGAMPPYLVLSELQRRKLLRSGAASTPPPASSVAQDTVRDTLQQIAPPPPAGPPPPPGMASPSRNPPQQGGPMPGAQPPANMGMPPRGMQTGGLVGQDDAEDDPTQPLSIQEMINRSARSNRLDPRFMQSVAGAESNYNPKAISPKGAIGPMQLMPATAASMGADPTDPQQNVDAGGRILRRLMDKYHGNIPMVLAAYNAGEGAVAKYGGIPPYPETHAYIRDVTNRMKQPIPGTEKTGLPGVPTMRAAVDPTSRNFLSSSRPALARSGPAAPMQASAIQPEAQPEMTAEDFGPSPDLPGAGSLPEMGPSNQPTMSAEDFGAPAPSFGGLAALAPPAPWQAPIPQTVLDAREQERAASQRLHDLITGHKSPFDPESIDRNKAAMEAAGLKPRDWSKEDAAVAEAMKAAKAGLHPSISQILLQMGMGLLASRSPHFGVALGEAGMGTMQGIEKRRAAARDDYVAALRAGIDLSAKKNSYDEKMAELNYAQAKADERAYTEQQKEAEREQAAAHREKVKAETDAQKAQMPSDPRIVAMNPDQFSLAQRKAAADLLAQQHPEKAEPGPHDFFSTVYLPKFAESLNKTVAQLDKNELNQAHAEYSKSSATNTSEGAAAMEAAAQSLAKNDMTPLKYLVGLRGIDRLLLFKRVQEINPKFNTADIDRKIKMEDYYANGKGANNLQSFGTFLEHGGAAADALQQIHNTQSRYANKALNWWRNNMAGSPEYANLIGALEPVRKEFEGFLLGGRALYEDDRKQANIILSEDSSPDQITAALKRLGHTALARLNEENFRYKKVMGHDLVDPVSPEARVGAQKMGVPLPQLGLVKMRAPNGQEAWVPEADVADMEAKKAVRIP